MGRIGKHLKSEISKYIEQTIETRLNFKQTALTFAPSGDDSPPLRSDRVVLVSIDGNGKFAAVGVLTTSQGAKPGEKIIYSRSKSGDIKAILSLLNDGKVKLEAPEEILLKTEKGMKIESGDNIEIDSPKEVSVKAQKTTLTGGQLKCRGTATPSGTGCFCALQICPVTGAPHSGETVENA
ncbi:MAG: hypothetical protein J6T20_04785 [Treponema sp.]|nr:hypothetical protein [Treponema sp.]